MVESWAQLSTCLGSETRQRCTTILLYFRTEIIEQNLVWVNNYLSVPSHHPRPFLLFLLPALDKVGDPGRQAEVVGIISWLFLLVLFVLTMTPCVVAPDRTVDAVISGW